MNVRNARAFDVRHATCEVERARARLTHASLLAAADASSTASTASESSESSASSSPGEEDYDAPPSDDDPPTSAPIPLAPVPPAITADVSGYPLLQECGAAPIPRRGGPPPPRPSAVTPSIWRLLHRRGLLAPVDRHAKSDGRLVLRPKPGGKELRIITDLRRANACRPPYKGLRQPTAADAMRAAVGTHFAVVFDARSWFHQVPQRTGPVIRGPPHLPPARMTRLAMGAARSSDVAGAIFRDIIGTYPRSVIVTDGGAVFCRTYAAARGVAATIKRRALRAGITWKTTPHVTRAPAICGIAIDLRRQRWAPRCRPSASAAALATARTWHPRLVQRAAGVASWLRSLVGIPTLGPLVHAARLKSPFRPTGVERSSVRVLLELIRHPPSLPLKPPTTPPPTARMATDASDVAMAVVGPGRLLWWSGTRKGTIPGRELRALCQAITAADGPTAIMCDCLPAIAAVTNGFTRIKGGNALVYRTLASLRHPVSISYVPSSRNPADAPSRARSYRAARRAAPTHAAVTAAWRCRQAPGPVSSPRYPVPRRVARPVRDASPRFAPLSSGAP